MSGVEPTQIDYQGLKMISEDDTQSITFKMEGTNKGMILDYDLTGTAKQFKITSAGINWTDGTSNHTTGLERLALVQTAFQAVELPPNATTLKLNDTILLDAGTIDTSSLNNLSLTITDGATYTGSYTKNFIDLLYNGGDTELYITNDPANFKIELTDSLNSVSSKITPSSYILSDGVLNPSLSYANNDLVLDSDTGRLLLNSADNEFYIGQYNASTAPCIVSSGNAGMSLNLNSRSGTATMGDCDNAFNSTKISVADTTSTITLDGTNVDFVNTTTTTSTSNHNANIRATSTGLETTTFLKLKLNGTDIWIPYFTTDPSL